MGVLQQTAQKFDQYERRIRNENTRQHHRDITVYQDLNAQTRTAKISIYINNRSLKTRIQHEAEREKSFLE